MSTIDVLAWASRSITRTFCRRPTARPYANIMVTVVFPTPPRRLDTAMNFVTEGFPSATHPAGRPLPDRYAPCEQFDPYQQHTRACGDHHEFDHHQRSHAELTPLSA